MRRCFQALLPIVLILSACEAVRAHTAAFSAAVARVSREGEIRVTLRFDVLAFILNDTSARIGDEPMRELLRQQPPVLEPKIAEAAARLLHGVTAQTDAGEVVFTKIQFPTAQEILETAGEANTARLPLDLEAELTGRLPAASKSLSVRFPEVLDSLLFTVDRPEEEIWFEPIQPGTPSSRVPIRVGGQKAAQTAAVAPVGTTATAPADRIAGSASKPAASAAGTASGPSPAPEGAGEPGLVELLWRYVAMGFHHILPRGIDHVLFILGLVLLNPKARPLLLQVSAFTLAHSITLGLSVYGVLRLPAAVVEPLIALSIAFVAIENILTSELKPWRPVVVFGFGLVHGLGFAGALNDLGLARRHFLSALIGFNSGVELGQLTVVLLALACIGVLVPRRCYRAVVAIPASGAIALVALIWTIQRLPPW